MALRAKLTVQYVKHKHRCEDGKRMSDKATDGAQLLNRSGYVVQDNTLSMFFSLFELV
jgi:hypothetical protein